MGINNKDYDLNFEGEQFPIVLSDWIREQKREFGDNAFFHPNSEYFKVLEEISQHENQFIANSNDLTDKAVKHSNTYNHLLGDVKEFVTSMLQDEIFEVAISKRIE